MDNRPSRGGEGGSYSDPTTFARVAENFEALRDCSEEDRCRRMKDLEARDPAVAAEVRALLELHSRSDALDQPDLALDPRDVAAAVERAGREAAPSPSAIGPWRVLRLIGRGGMGAVYLAERADGEFERQVAIKLLRADAHDPELMRRFRAERRILAALAHPHIAALLDSGSTDDGRPYVVMELVDGEDLVTWCQRNDVPLRQRVGLLAQVCDAVAHAHRNLVVHRDLKPSNIMVTVAGEPKLLDFGIAKLLAPDDEDSPQQTLTGAGTMLLTPEYASPEQVRGESITTATDVYALGAVMYEVLTGRRAQPLPTRLLSDLERVVCHQEPPPPSDAVLRNGGNGEARERGRLARQLRGDLDTIVLTALHKEPARRYGSAAALGDDLRRYLGGQPVQARRDTWTYRWSKFVRLHRWSVATVAAFVLLLATATVVTAVQAARIADERDVARRETSVAKEIGDFLVGLYEMAEPDPTRANQLRARDLLDRGSRRIRHELGSGPLVRASLMHAMGRAYAALGLYGEAEPLLVEADRLRRESGASAVDLAQSTYSLASVIGARGDYQTAEQQLRAALAAFEALGPEARELESETLLELAETLREVGDGEAALELNHRGEQVAIAAHGPRHRRVARALTLRARTHRDRGEFPQALEAIEAAYRMQQELFGLDHPAHAGTLRELGAIHKELGNYEAARDAVEKALAFDRKTSGNEHPDVDADLFQLAMIEGDMGDLDRALALMHEVLERDRQRLGDHAYVAMDLGQIARLLSARGDFEESEQLFDEALEMQRRLLPQDHPELATTLDNLSTLYNRTDRPERVGPLLEEALAIRLRVFPPEHPSVLITRSKMAVQHHNRGELQKAEQQYRAVLEVQQRTLGQHPSTAANLYRVAVAVRDQGRFPEALAMAEESLAMYRAKMTPGHLDLARPLLLMGMIHNAAGRHAAAEPLLREAWEIRKQHLAPDHYDGITAERELGRCLADLQRFAEAEQHLRSALQRCLATFGPGHRRTAGAQEVLAGLYDRWDKPEEAARVRDGK